MSEMFETLSSQLFFLDLKVIFIPCRWRKVKIAKRLVICAVHCLLQDRRIAVRSSLKEFINNLSVQIAIVTPCFQS